MARRKSNEERKAEAQALRDERYATAGALRAGFQNDAYTINFLLGVINEYGGGRQGEDLIKLAKRMDSCLLYTSPSPRD